MLPAAALFHLGLEVSLDVGIFSPVMWVALFAFFEESDWDWLARWTGRLFPVGWIGISRPSWSDRRSLLVAALVAIPLTGVLTAIQFPLNRPPSDEFVEIPPETMREILAEKPWPVGDYFHRVELGTRFTNLHTRGRSELFHPGEIVYLAGRLLREHPALDLEVHLIAPDEGEFTHELTVGETPSHVLIPLRMTEDHPLGRYRLELRGRRADTHDGWETIERMSFQLKPR
jgi:hypothetical protein